MPLYENLVSYYRSFKAFSSAAMFFNNLNGSESAFRQSFALTSFFVRRRWLHFLNLFPDLHLCFLECEIKQIAIFHVITLPLLPK